MPQSSDEVIRNAATKAVRKRAAKILAKMKGSRLSEVTLTELIAGEFEELTR
jgi:hypothetical protein